MGSRLEQTRNRQRDRDRRSWVPLLLVLLLLVAGGAGFAAWKSGLLDRWLPPSTDGGSGVVGDGSSPGDNPAGDPRRAAIEDAGHRFLGTVYATAASETPVSAELDLHGGRMIELAGVPDTPELLDTLRSGMQRRIASAVDADETLRDLVLARLDFVPHTDERDVIARWRAIVELAEPAPAGEPPATRVDGWDLWLALDADGQWRVYDVSQPGIGNVRWMTMIGRVARAAQEHDERRVRTLEEKFDRFQLLQRTFARQPHKLSAREVDPMIADPALDFAQTSIRAMRLQALVNDGKPAGVIDAWARQTFEADEVDPLAHRIYGNWQFLNPAPARHESIVTHLRACIDESGPDRATCYQLGMTLQRLGRGAEARRVWQLWIAVAPGFDGCHYEAASHDAATGAVASCLELVGRIIDDPSYASFVQLLLRDLAQSVDPRNPAGVAAFGRFLTRHRQHLPPGCRTLHGRLIARFGDVQEAIIEFRRVATTSADRDDVIDALDQLLALESLGADHVLELLPGLVEREVIAEDDQWKWEGRANIAAGQRERAREVFADALRGGIDNGVPLPRFDLYAALRGLHDANGPDEILDGLNALPYGGPIDAWKYRAWALVAVDRVGDARAECLRAAASSEIQSVSERTDILRYLLELDGGPTAVLQAIERRREPWINQFWFHAFALERLGRRDEALEVYAKAATTRWPGPDGGDAQLSALQQLRHRGHPQRALDLMRSARAINDDALRAACLADLGRTSDAADAWMLAARDRERWSLGRYHAMRRVIATDPQRALDALRILQDGIGAAFSRLLIGEAHAALGDTDEAIARYREIAVAGGEHHAERIALRRLIELSPAGAQVALDLISSMPEREGPAIQLVEAEALRAAGRYRDAIARLDRLVADYRAAPIRSAVRELLLRVMQDAGETGAALTLAAEWASAERDWTTRIRLQGMRAALLVKASRTDEARDVLQQLRDHPPRFDGFLTLALPAIDELTRQAALWAQPTHDVPVSPPLVRGLWDDPELGPWLRDWYTSRHGVPPHLGN